MAMTTLNKLIASLKNDDGVDISTISDGYHTFKELYQFITIYNACLFNEWASEWRKSDTVTSASGIPFAVSPKYDVHKSMRFYNGKVCSDGEMFIVAAELPEGRIMNCYNVEHWGLFKIPDYETIQWPFDDHDSETVLNILKKLSND